MTRVAVRPRNGKEWNGNATMASKDRHKVMPDSKLS